MNERALIERRLDLHQTALDLLMIRKFHPWEGGEGKVTGQFVLCCTELAKGAIEAGNFEVALKHLETTENYPHNLGEGKLYGAKENDIWFWKGMAYKGLGLEFESQKAWEMAAQGKIDLSISMYYNDQNPNQIFYQGLALEKLDKEDEAKAIFEQLVAYGEAHQNDEMTIDYFAVSLPDLAIWEGDLNERNRENCLYLMDLGCLGLKDFEAGQKALKEVNKNFIFGGILAQVCGFVE